MLWDNREDGLIELALEKKEWTTIRELKEEFERRTNIRVSTQRVHQVVDALSDEDREGGPRLEKTKEDRGGNKVKLFRRKDK